MFSATDDEINRSLEDQPASGDNGLSPVTRGHLGLLRRWLACTLGHRGAHRWYPRYLGGYGYCQACGREWD